MTISPISSAAAAATSTTAKNQLQASSDDFLKLFMAQLQQQDPLNPEKGSDMVAQLAQLSAVEQGAQTNQQLQALAAAQASSSNANLASLVGRTCDASVGDFHLASTGTPPPIQLSAGSSMHGASLVITDDSGKEVRRIPLPDGTSGTLQWDGRGANGVPLPAGAYHAAIDPGTSTAAITATWHGTVSSIDLGGDGTHLAMGDLLLDPASISSIGATGGSTTTTTTSNGAHP